MKIEQLTFRQDGWKAEPGSGATALADTHLVLVFGDRHVLEAGKYFQPLRDRYPGAHIVSCSSGGDITGARVTDGTATATALSFDTSRVQAVVEPIAGADDSEEAGRRLARRLPAEGLRHVLLLAEGLEINGSAFTRGIQDALPDGVTVSGGLAADGERFERTIVGLDAPPAAGQGVAVGLYGPALTVSTGSHGGWSVFGSELSITRSKGNVLYEVNGGSALALFRELLGPLGYALPASGLLFPIEIREDADSPGLVRTILGVNEAEGSVTFAGDVPTGWLARVMRATLDEVIEAAGTAARNTNATQVAASGTAGLVIAVSCIGRKLLLQRRVEAELARVAAIFGPGAHTTGFYSYGEIGPTPGVTRCELHNQTMTLTVISER